MYIYRPTLPGEIATEHDLIYKLLLNKWYIDEIYNFIFVRPVKWLARLFWKGGDGAVIDGFGPDGIAASVLYFTRRAVGLQTGFVYHYAFAMLLGIAGLVSWFMLDREVCLDRLADPLHHYVSAAAWRFFILLIRGDEATSLPTMRARWLWDVGCNPVPDRIYGQSV